MFMRRPLAPPRQPAPRPASQRVSTALSRLRVAFRREQQFQLYAPDLHNSHPYFLSTDLQCLCTNSEFDQTSIQCIRANCTAAERTQAIQLQQDECTGM